MSSLITFKKRENPQRAPVFFFLPLEKINQNPCASWKKKDAWFFAAKIQLFFSEPRSQLWAELCMFYCADSSAAASDSLVYTAALPVSKAHCASQSTAKLISHTLSVKLTPHRLKPTKSVNNKKEKKSALFRLQIRNLRSYLHAVTATPRWQQQHVQCAMLTSGDLRQ